MANVLVIGAGAAGLMAAGAAVRQGHTVTVLEHKEKPAQKILVTGKGRCNVTNDCTAEEFLHHVRTNPRFLYSSLGAFPPAKTMELFEELGITGIDPEQYNADYLNNLALCTRTIDGAEELCRFIHENGVLIVATNGVSATQHRRIAASGLEPWLDKVVVSDDAGAEKPAPRYFERAFAVSGAGDKSECIIIGDSLTSDIRGGQQFGIDTCWFNPKHKGRGEFPAPDYELSELQQAPALLKEIFC